MDKLIKKIILTTKEINYIKQIFTKYFDNKDHLWIFGSRVNLQQKVGDIDLYIEILLEQKIKFLVELKQSIGDQKIDVIINAKYLDQNLLIYEEAKATGIMLI